MAQKIVEIKQGNKNSYMLDYKEEMEDDCIIITSTLKIPFAQNSMKRKILQAWKSEKSPLLIELQKFYKNHSVELKEEKCSKYYEDFIGKIKEYE